VQNPPDERQGASVATLNGIIYMFGGGGEGAALGEYLSDTWAWDGTTWTQLDVSGPSARAGAAMAPLGDKLVLFGGGAPGEYGLEYTLDDTWTFDGTSWTQIMVTGPSSRGGGVMQPLGDKLVLFGGSSCAGNRYTWTCNVLGDTWTWDGTAWTALDVSGPSARSIAAMAPTGDELVLYGGYTTSLDAGDGNLGDMWSWNGTAWTQLPVTGGIGPMYGNVMTEVSSGVLMFDCQDSQTWASSGTSWTRVATVWPPNVFGMMATL
jgi:N-acetylneuraminic acid mutarotase